MSRPTPQFPLRALLLVLLVALCARAALLASGAVSFHADEAVVGLMARHILQGARPTFFYGQAYMGSLDAWLVALGFATLGDSVQTIRIVQSVLYLLVVASGFVVAWRLSERVTVAVVAGLLLAVPAVNTTLYTTATLGGYNETLLLGNLLLLLGYDVTHEHARSWPRWVLLGLLAGVGWWANALIVAYALPVALLVLHGLWRRVLPLRAALPYILLALAGFIVGSAPWWVFDFQHDHAALAMFLRSQQVGEFEGIGIPYVPPGQRALGLLLIGLPALVGLRFPWESGYFLPLIGIPVLLIYAFAIFYLLRGHNPLKPEARGLVLGMLGLFCLIFVASTFGADPTGRYFLPLALPLGIVLGALVESLRIEWQGRPALVRLLPGVLVALVIGYQAAGQVAAASSPSGLTTQFDPVSHIANDHDDALIAFLDEHDLHHGYSNYWVAFRLAFLSGERMQYSAALPYKTDLSYNAADKRYPPLTSAAEGAERVAYITTNLPALDDVLTTWFAANDYEYEFAQVGPFNIYYDFMPAHPRPPERFG